MIVNMFSRPVLIRTQYPECNDTQEADIVATISAHQENSVFRVIPVNHYRNGQLQQHPEHIISLA